MQHTHALTFGSLFAGIGGIDLGLERAGMTCKWQVEIDDYASKVLAKHWPNVTRFRDVRECGARNLTAVDLVAGGFPCQDISYAGRGAGLSGERSGLWFEFARIVCELRPRYVLVENVSALLTRGIDAVLGTLASFGYDAEWHCIPAAAVGAPHKRDRVFIVAYSQGRPGRERGLLDASKGWRSSLKLRGLYSLGMAERRERAREWLAREPRVARMVHGLPRRIYRLRRKGLGNAVVPQVAEFIGQLIVEGDRALRSS